MHANPASAPSVPRTIYPSHSILHAFHIVHLTFSAIVANVLIPPNAASATDWCNSKPHSQLGASLLQPSLNQLLPNYRSCAWKPNEAADRMLHSFSMPNGQQTGRSLREPSLCYWSSGPTTREAWFTRCQQAAGSQQCFERASVPAALTTPAADLSSSALRLRPVIPVARR